MSKRWVLLGVVLAAAAGSLFLLRELRDRPGAPPEVAPPCSAVGEETGDAGRAPESSPPSRSADAAGDGATPTGKRRVPEFRAERVSVPRSLLTVMGREGKNVYSTRNNAVKSMGKDLAADEIQSLYALLNRKRAENGLKSGHLNALKNSVLNVLGSQREPPADYANNLMAMYYDRGHDSVWRDYCIQHLGGWYARAGEKEKQAIAATLWDATKETKLGIAGTALIALASNCDDSGIDTARVAERALTLGTSAECGTLAKITALQICAQLGERKVLPTARSIAGSRSAVTLRMSAIAAVGTLGDESDKPMLSKYAASTDVRLRKAARSALSRLRK